MPFGVSDSQLKIVIEAQNNAKAAFEEVESDLKKIKDESKGFEELSSTFKKTGLAVTGFGLGVGALLVDAGLLAARVEVLGTVLENIGRVSGISSEYLYEQEKVIRDLGITTKEAREILILFMQGQLDVAQASEIARTAQDLAVIAGVNSSEAAKTLTEAIVAQRPMLLRQFGIVQDLNDVYLKYGENLGLVTEQIDKNGKVTRSWSRELTDVEKRQAMINMILEEGGKITGTYEAAMGDVGKQLTSLPRYIEEVRLAFGKAFIPVIGIAVEKLTELFKWFSALSPETKKMATYGAMAAAGLALIVGPTLLLIGFLPALGAGFAVLTGTFGGIVVAITAAVAVLGLLIYTGWTVYKNWNEIVAGYKIIFQEWRDTIVNFLQEIIETFKTIWNGIVEIVTSAIESVKTVLNDIVEFFKFWGEIILFAITETFTTIWYFLLGVVKVWAEVLRPIWEPLVEATVKMIDWLKLNFEIIKNAFAVAWDTIKESVTLAVNAISETITSVMDAVWNWLKPKLEDIRDLFVIIWNEITEKTDIAVNTVKDVVSSAIETLKDIWGRAWDWIAQKVQDAWDMIQGPISSIIGAFDKAIDLVGRVISRAKEAAGEIVEIGRGIIPVPGFQAGGIVPGPIGRPMPAIVHGGETIVPAGRALGGITINITGNTFMSDEEAAEMIGDRIIRILKTQNRFIY